MPINDSHSHFSALLQDLALTLGRAELEFLPSLHEPTVIDLSVDAVPITLIYSPEDRPDDLLMLCCLGPLPQHAAESGPAMERLLQMNFAMAATPANLGIDPASGDVMLTLYQPVREVDNESLTAAMIMAAAQAGLWRETRFLRQADRAPP